MKTKIQKRNQRKTRIRAKVAGTAKKPRLSVHKSNKYLFAQLIDDVAHKSIVGLSTKKLAVSLVKGKKRTEVANVLGQEIAKLAKGKKITSVVFDRAGYKYHGVVKNFADGARKGGLKF